MENNQFLIRPANSSDFVGIIAIYNAVIDEGGLTADIEQIDAVKKIEFFNSINTPTHGIYVICVGKKVIGYFYFSPWRAGRMALQGCAEISYYLHKDYRSKGLGSKMMEKMLTLAKEKSFTHLLAILLDINQGSVRILKKYGFEQVGWLKNVAQLPNQRCGQALMMKYL